MNERLPKDGKPTLVATVGSAQGSQHPEWSQQPQSESEGLPPNSPGIAIAARNAVQARLNIIRSERES